MDLSSEIFRVKGRARKPLSASLVRQLEEADMALLGAEKGSQPPALKRLSERHHALARNLASGMSEGEAAIVCGYNISRVSILKNDPAFNELLSFYQGEVDLQYRDLHERLSGLALDAADELSTRLEDEPEKFSIGQLMEVTKLGADRTGHGPNTNGVSLNGNFVVQLPPKASNIEDWSSRHGLNENAKVIEHQPIKED